MSRPPLDLTRKIKDILHHNQPLPDEDTAETAQRQSVSMKVHPDPTTFGKLV